PAMIRTHTSLEYQQARALDHQAAVARHEQEKRLPKVMVVDDSVTVRKVTTRLLERHGMEVLTAKDGMHAMEVLQDHKPDVMLLDIEMPRMDGFEVASLVRHDERLKDVPIIMITSRTGDKHRERAMSIGVNAYMGKPFQEDALLENINHYLGQEVD
ncbi:MAG: response regulator, partial [Alteromonas sp.]|uniref:response regulator n=1 Tax=Alteromonas sp. TaxID=232 RepID=UPI0032D91768